MNKKSTLRVLLNILFPIIFNIIFFFSGDRKYPDSVWISYAFIHLAYILLIIVPLFNRKSNVVVFNLSINSVSITYFIVEFITGLIIIFVKPEEYKVALIVQIVIVAIYSAILIVNLLANETSADSIEIHEKDVAYIKNMSSIVRNLLYKAESKESKKILEKIYDEIHSSPSKSVIACAEIEQEINYNICELEKIVNLNDENKIKLQGEYLLSLIYERNNMLKSFNIQ